MLTWTPQFIEGDIDAVSSTQLRKKRLEAEQNIKSSGAHTYWLADTRHAASELLGVIFKQANGHLQDWQRHSQYQTFLFHME